MKSKVYAVILAGGKGTRLWPLSKKGRSKSFVEIASRRPMIVDTVERLKGLIEKKDVLFVIDKGQEKNLKSILKWVKNKNVVLEPFGRSTASAVGLAAISVDPESILVVLPTDASIDKPGLFRKTIRNGVEFIKKNKGAMVCFGVKTKDPSVSYGYIKTGRRIGGPIFTIDRFIEKPGSKKAKKLIEEGDCFWNAGIFIFRAADILDAMRKHAKGLYAELERIRENKKDIKKAYSRMRDISIDCQIMEKTRNLYCVLVDFGWHDLGNWLNLEGYFEKDRGHNISYGDVRIRHSHNISVYNFEKGTIGVVGARDIVVAHTDSGILICDKKQVEKVKELGVI